MTNFSTADILVYKDGGTTERASVSGFTATTDFDAKTGKHLAIIDLSDNTTSAFWNAGSEYLVAIDSVTIDAVATGGWVARFRIGYPDSWFDTTLASLSSQTSFTLTAGPAEDDAINGCTVVIHDIASAVQCGWGIVLDYTGSTKTVTLVAGTTFTVSSGDNISIMRPHPLQAATMGRLLVVDAAGLADANAVKVGPTGSGTAQTARDLGTSVLLSNGTGTGQISLSSGAVLLQATQTGVTIPTVTTLTNAPSDSSGVTTLLSRVPSGIFTGMTSLAQWLGAIAGKQTGNSTARTEIRATGGGSGTFDETTDSLEALRDNVGTAGVGLSNIGTVATVTNLTNAPTAGDLTATMKTSVGTAVAASAVASVTGNVGGNVTGSVGSVASGGLTRASFAADTGLQTVRSNTAQAGAAGTVTLDASASATTDFYVGAWIFLTGGTGVGQARICTAYNGTSKVATIAPNWATNPDSSSTFAVLAAAQITGVQGSVTGSVASVTGNVGGNVTGSVGSVTGNVGGNVTGSVGSVTGAVGSVTGNVGGNVTGSVGSLGTTAKSDVNGEVVDALSVDTYAEPSSVPAATASLRAKIGWMFLLTRNLITQTSTTQTVKADDGTTTVASATVSDDGTTFSRGEYS